MGKGDTNGIAPGSDEANAILAFANQQIADDHEGDAFYRLLDTELHARAAQGIVEFRAGGDGTFGTSDDATFPDIHELDAVPWVGTVAFAKLLALADAAGYFSGGTPCDEHSNGGWIQNARHLSEIQASRCTFFAGDVIIDVPGRLLPAQRTLKALDNVRRIEGRLAVLDTSGFDSLIFRGLTFLNEYDSEVFDETGDLSEIEFRALNDAKTITLSGKRKVTFPALRTLDEVTIRANTMTPPRFVSLENVGVIRVESDLDRNHPSIRGFNALNHAEEIYINAERIDGFDALETAKNITLHAGSRHNRVRDEIEIDGFGELEEVGQFSIRVYPQLDVGFDISFDSLPSLKRAERIDFGPNYIVFPELEEAGTIEVEGQFEGEFPRLVHADSIKIGYSTEQFPFPKLVEVTYGFELGGGVPYGETVDSPLERVGASMKIGRFSEFENLEYVGGKVTVSNVWNGLNNLTTAGSVEIRGSVSGFEALTETGDVTIFWHGHDFAALENLVAARSVDLRHTFHSRATFLPSLEIVERDVRIDADLGRFVGLDALEEIGGSLYLYRGDEIDCLQSLTSVGGRQIGFDRRLDDAEINAFLGQITYFPGDIVTLSNRP